MGGPDDDGSKRRGHRALSAEELKLWGAVTRDTRPLSERKTPETVPEPLSPAPIPAIVPEPEKNRQKNSVTVTKSRLSSIPPPLTGLDRRTSQRLARGQIEAEAKLDLHGQTRESARSRLLGFLGRTSADGLRCVLVVTGKGESPFARHTLHGSRYHDAPEHSGVLRSSVAGWFAEPEFRALVAGFQPAHPRHGGGGAFYVWLRKKR